MSGIPREVLMWLQAMNLTYKVKNPKRDLANGFVISEILSRYYTAYDKEQDTTKISTHCFDTGFSMQAKKTNWGLLGKIFKKQQIPVTDKEIDSVMNCANDAALQMLLKVYSFLTGKTTEQAGRPSEKEETMPDYAKPTIFQKLKDKQIIRIEDKKKLAQVAEEVIVSHNQDQQNQRLTKMDRFTKPKRIIIRDPDPYRDTCVAKQRKQESKMRSSPGEEQEGKDVKEVKVKAAGGKELAKAKMSRRAALTSAEEETVVISFDAVLNDVINSVLSSKMEREDKEDMQEYKEYEEKRRMYLIKRFADRDPADIEQIFGIMLERAEDLAKSLAANAVDFPNYMNFVVLLFQQMQPFTEPFGRTFSLTLTSP